MRVLDPLPTVASGRSASRADDMAVIVEDLIKLLDGVGNGLRRGRHPAAGDGQKVAAVLRAVADDLEG